MKLTSIFRVTPLAAAVGVALLGGVAIAEADPLSLRLSQTFTRDSNLLRDDADKRSDVISSTGVGLNFNKPYGRQVYRASLNASRNSYNNNTQFNNNGFGGDFGFDSDLGSDFRLSLAGSADESLPRFEDQGNRSVRNTQKTSQASIDLKYGLYGKWSLNTGLSSNNLRYAVVKTEEKTSRGSHVGVTYLPDDLTAFSSTYYDTRTDAPNRFGGLGDKIQRSSLDFGAAYQVTGLSLLRGNVALTDEKHPADSRLNFKGVTGAASWAFTPAGKVSYALSWQRDTNNSGTSSAPGSSNSFYTTNSQLTNTMSLSAKWQATGKLAMSTAYTHATYKENYGQFFGSLSGSTSDNGRYHGWSLGVDYQALQSVGVNCTLQNYDRTASIFSRAYSGDTVSCGANLVIDRLP
ncbi:MAG: hypothetical protein KGL90_02735 [Burkholderiales bacterium]|nr:hypothetical protein [Burkholderiales bacterium]